MVFALIDFDKSARTSLLTGNTRKTTSSANRELGDVTT